MGFAGFVLGRIRAGAVGARVCEDDVEDSAVFASLSAACVYSARAVLGPVHRGCERRAEI